MTAWDFAPIAAKYVKNGGYLSEETRVLIQEFFEQNDCDPRYVKICNGGYLSEETRVLIQEFLEQNDCDPRLYVSILKNILEDAVDEALGLFD